MRSIDYSFIKKEIPGSIVGLVHIISDLNAKEQFRIRQYTEVFEKLQKKAMIESVKGSNAIEGIVNTDNRIRDIVNGAEPVSHDEAEISGYKDALNLIHTSYEELDFTEEVICSFHKMKTAGTPGSAAETPDAMEQLVLAYIDARQDSEIPVLFLIPCVIVDFLCIHPFSDGNGRVSRLLTVLMLYIAGYDISRYVSVEGQINKYKESYYAALEQSSKGWHEGTNDYVPFITNFLQILYKCFKDLDDSFTEISLKKAKK